MNRYEIALGIKPPPRKPMHALAGMHYAQMGPGLLGQDQAFFERQRYLAELERQHIMADQAFFDRYSSQDRTP